VGVERRARRAGEHEIVRYRWVDESAPMPGEGIDTALWHGQAPLGLRRLRVAADAYRSVDRDRGWHRGSAVRTPFKVDFVTAQGAQFLGSGPNE
jgi:hypothetical protein